ncbi:LruC domain-containing protein [bacterium]|nr:LruC domain-containing protein [bacterium]
MNVSQVIRVRHWQFGQGVSFALLALLALSQGCRPYSKEDLQNQINDNSLQIPAGFDFATSLAHQVKINVRDAAGKAMKNIAVSISIPDDKDSFQFVCKGFTNESGQFTTSLVLSANVTEVLVQTKYLGLPPNHLIPVEMLSDYTISTQGMEPDGFLQPKGYSSAFKAGGISSKFCYLGTWDNLGVPNYKKSVRDVIPQSFLDDVNSSLPEGRPVPTYNAEYLADGVETNTIITKTADVWITFVHEGAGYKNALGFYKYDANHPPTSVSQLDSLFIIFPNVSYSGSGGGLVSGDKVHIGRFKPGTAIGWFLVANGYNSSSHTVGNGYHVVFSDKQLNPESSATLKQHNVLLYDETRDVILLGFEDLRRDGSCDNDFNDAIFFVTSNPVDGVERAALQSTKKAIDSDGDGVYDYADDFPFDPTKSSSGAVPTSTTNGSLCFEDSWPNMGDYDFNDMVMDYQYTYYSNAQNKVTKITATFLLQAIGASFKNGFGFQFDVAPSAIYEVKGCEYTDGLVTLNANGTEANQSKATIIVFDNAHKHMRRPANATYVNTEAGAAVVSPKRFSVEITFTNPVSLSELGKAPYNVFMFANATRGREIHMMDQAPTDLADISYFGTGSDISNPDVKRYYQNKENMPWVLHTPETFYYPTEHSNIFDCYPYFSNWAQSEGRSNTNWYFDLPGYRVSQKIFTR